MLKVFVKTLAVDQDLELEFLTNSVVFRVEHWMDISGSSSGSGGGGDVAVPPLGPVKISHKKWPPKAVT